MPITRDLGRTIVAVDPLVLITCSTVGGQTLASTVQTVASPTTNASTQSGRVIDRLDPVLGFLGQPTLAAEVFGWLQATRGSTEANRQMTLGIRLQHGDSSGGGDAVAWSTAFQPADVTFFTTAGTTPMSGWSTGPFYGWTNPGVYNLTGAKRYLTVQLTATKNKTTTESSGDEGSLYGAVLRFGAGSEVPFRSWALTTAPGSTATS